MLTSQGALLPQHTHTHSHGLHADTRNPHIRHTCLLTLTLAGARTHTHTHTFPTMQCVCCSGTTSAVKAILASSCFSFPLPYFSASSHPSFTRPSLISPFTAFPLFFPLPSFLFCPPPLSFLCLSLSLFPFLPLEAGDVEGCSAVSDYQA